MHPNFCTTKRTKLHITLRIMTWISYLTSGHWPLISVHFSIRKSQGVLHLPTSMRRCAINGHTSSTVNKQPFCRMKHAGATPVPGMHKSKEYYHMLQVRRDDSCFAKRELEPNYSTGRYVGDESKPCSTLKISKDIYIYSSLSAMRVYFKSNEHHVLLSGNMS